MKTIRHLLVSIIVIMAICSICSVSVKAEDNYLHYEEIEITHVHAQASGVTNTCFKCTGCSYRPTVMGGWGGNPDNTYYSCPVCGNFWRCDGSIPTGTQVPCNGKIYTAQHNETPRIGTITFSIDESLQATIDVDNVYMDNITYAWSTGADTNSIKLTQVGTYTCTISYKDTMSLATRTTTVSYTLVDREPPAILNIDTQTDRAQYNLITVTAEDDVSVTGYKIVGEAN